MNESTISLKEYQRLVSENAELRKQVEQLQAEDEIDIGKAYDLYDKLRTALYEWMDEGPDEDWISSLMITIAFGRLMFDVGRALAGLTLEEIENEKV